MLAVSVAYTCARDSPRLHLHVSGSTLERTQRQFESFAALAVAQQLAAEKLVARFAEPS